MFSILTIFKTLDFNSVRIAKWLFSIASVVFALLAWGLIVAIGTVAVLFALSSIIGLLYFQRAVGLEKRRLLRKNDLLSPSLNEQEKENQATKLAVSEIQRNIKKNMSVGNPNE